MAGFETTANTLSTLCYELARRPDLQEAIRAEVGSGDVSVDAIERMEYLEATVLENLRLNSPINVHFRVCMKDCEVSSFVCTPWNLRTFVLFKPDRTRPYCKEGRPSGASDSR